jgi:hypothetical protein
MNIVLHPRKAKPSWLAPPCSTCETYEEEEGQLHADVKAVLHDKKGQDFNHCRFDPAFGDPAVRHLCPHQNLMSETRIWLECDNCHQPYKLISINDPSLQGLLATGDMRVDLCPACQKLPEEKLTMQKNVIVLAQKKPV